MAKKEVEVRCPCCETRLLVDTGTGKLLRSWREGEPGISDGDWDAARARAEASGDRGQDAFTAAIEREKARDRDLDDLFRETRERLDRGPEGDLS